MNDNEASAYRRGVAAAKAQAAARGCAKPLGFARWDFDGSSVHLRPPGGKPKAPKVPPFEMEGGK